MSNNVIQGALRRADQEALEINSRRIRCRPERRVGRMSTSRRSPSSFEVPQQALNRLSSGQTATVRFLITGEKSEGRHRHLRRQRSRQRDADLPGGNLDPQFGRRDRRGHFGRDAIPTDEGWMAHFVSPSVVSLDPGGRLGVKTVDDENVVQFHPIEIVRAEIDGIWVTGLPEDGAPHHGRTGLSVNDGETVRRNAGMTAR